MDSQLRARLNVRLGRALAVAESARVIFRIKDRGSGYYLASGPAGWKMIPPRDRRFAYMIAGPDPACREVRHGLAAIYEFFGEDPRNGFELVVEPVFVGEVP
jgi:hypothetical protein